MTNLDSGLGTRYGSDKDKAVDLKIQLVTESNTTPAVAIGAHDFIGTRLFPAEYLVTGKAIGPFDISLGVGTKRLGAGGTEEYSLENLGVFGGIEWAVHERISLKAEYSPIKYENDVRTAGRVVPDGADSPINVGVQAEVYRGINVGLSWQRGDTVGFNCDLSLLLGKPIIPKAPNPPFWKTLTPSGFAPENISERLDTIVKEIVDANFVDVRVMTDNRVLMAEFENTRYLSEQKAAGRVLRILLANAPDHIRELSVVIKRRQIPFLKVTVDPERFDQYLMGRMREDIFEKIATVETVTKGYDAAYTFVADRREEEKLQYRWGIKPEVETFLNDPNGIIQARIGAKPYINANLWEGGDAVGAVMIPFYSNIDSANTPAPEAVASDSWQYQGTQINVSNLELNQVFKLHTKSFAMLRGGYFSEEYVGAGGEALHFIGDGTFAVGLQSDWAIKRKPGKIGEFYSDKNYYTLLGNLYYFFDPLDIQLTAQYGHFLGGDVGFRIEAKRIFDSGLEIGAWYSITDTSNFLTAENRDYNDKGVFMRLPARMFTPRETSTKYRYSFTPWTRDVAQVLPSYTKLYDIGYDLMPAVYKQNMGEMKE